MMSRPGTALRRRSIGATMSTSVAVSVGVEVIGCFSGRPVRDSHREDATGARRALQSDLAVHRLHETGDDPQEIEEHTSELQSLRHLVCRLLLEKKKKN